MAFRLSSQKARIWHPLDKKQTKLLVVFAGALVITLIVLYLNFFRSPSSDFSEDAAIDPGASHGGAMLEEINFDIDFLRNPFFKGSEFYGDDSLEVDERGRDDPFLPF